MKTSLTVSAVLALALTMATPALAEPHGRYRGQKRHCHVTRGVVRVAPAYYAAPVYAPPRPGFYFGFSAPGFYATVGTPVGYGPAPVVVGPSVVAAPPVWIPGHWAYDGGLRVYAEGHWRR